MEPKCLPGLRTSCQFRDASNRPRGRLSLGLCSLYLFLYVSFLFIPKSKAYGRLSFFPVGPVTGRGKGRAQRNTEHPSPQVWGCLLRAGSGSLAHLYLLPKPLAGLSGLSLRLFSPPVAFIHQMPTKSLLYLGAVLDAANQGQRLSGL